MHLQFAPELKVAEPKLVHLVSGHARELRQLGGAVGERQGQGVDRLQVAARDAHLRQREGGWKWLEARGIGSGTQEATLRKRQL